MGASSPSSRKDTEGDNALAIQLARQLIDKDQVLAIHGPQWSAEAEAVFPICERSKILCFSPTSTKPGVSAPYMWAFRNTVDENILVPQTLKWVKDNYPWVKKAAILTDIKDAYSKSLGHDTFRPKLKEFGIEVVEEVDYVTGDTDFSAHITKIKAKEPDMIAIGGTWVETCQHDEGSRKARSQSVVGRRASALAMRASSRTPARRRKGPSTMRPTTKTPRPR